MKQFHEEIAEEQEKAKVRVIKPPHALGFLDEDLRRDLREGNTPVKETSAVASA